MRRGSRNFPKPLDSTWCQSRSRRCGGDSSQRVEPSGTRRRGLGTGEARHRPGRGSKQRRGAGAKKQAAVQVGGAATQGCCVEAGATRV